MGGAPLFRSEYQPSAPLSLLWDRPWPWDGWAARWELWPGSRRPGATRNVRRFVQSLSGDVAVGDLIDPSPERFTCLFVKKEPS